MVEDALRHIVGVDDVTEHLYRVLVAQVDRRAGEAYERGVGQRVADDLRRACVHLTRLDVHLLLEAILSAVRLVGHHDDVVPL